jgi:regulator of RNase E activity RraB
VERPWEFGDKSGITATLKGVQVMELVEYSGGVYDDEFTYVEKPTAEITETEDEEDIPF